MAATDQTYRNQRTLDIVFGVSSVLMLLTIVWMFAQDYLREFKVEQRSFRDVEAAMANRAFLEALPNEVGSLADAERAVAEAKAEAEKARTDPDGKVHKAQVELARADADYRSLKAEYDSKESLYNIAVDEDNKARADALRAELYNSGGLRDRRDAAKVRVEEATRKLQEDQKVQSEAERKQADAEAKLKKMRTDLDRYRKLAKQKEWGWQDWILSQPVIDGFASPYKIQQFTLNDLPIDYSFKYVTRYDRCTTCHLGMDRAAYEPKALKELVKPPDALKAKLDGFRKMLTDYKQERQKALAEKQKSGPLSPGEKKELEDLSANVVAGFNLNDLPATVPTVAAGELTDARVKQFAAHPRLDLFVEANSPHPMEKFGCTICHGGQGSATDFLNATHTPNSPHQQEAWEKDHAWERIHFWDYPMLASRFTESACLKCHYQVTDLIRYGNKEEAPKLLKGWRLIRENGCFGCHEIAGVKSLRGDTPYARMVGPDLRLEPGVPPEQMNAADRAKVEGDPLSPPGTMRKVGPSLYRLSEKTNPEWVRKWVLNPRGFRPDTKMPHFYGISNNDAEALKGTGQEEFPNAEVAAIAHYLLAESRSYLSPGGDGDLYRRTNLARQKQLEDRRAAGGLSEPEKKELEEVTKRLERLASPNLELRGVPAPIAEGIHTADGRLVPLPPPPADDNAGQNARKNGRKLFSERGCLACHVHEGTAKKDDSGLPAVDGHAEFAPNLSLIASKLGTKPGDEESARRWLVQWILNPTLHHPRTRMPYTHLEPSEASDIALWLLGEGKNRAPDAAWAQAPIPDPSDDTLKALTRVYLGRVKPKQDVDALLGPTEDPQRAEAWLGQVRPDADEAYLTGGLTADKMKLYIGKKAISRLGCFGCHNIPGFEMAKPIGTPLNDWGKKDPERLAFENVVDYVEHKHTIVENLGGRADASPPGKSGPEVSGHGDAGKPPYEEYFFAALEHHQREGFLHQKLSEPRSYDYKRERAWDDRLRMPKFQFAHRVVQGEDEGDEAFAARKLREEAEAREAVMTFVLGLVAEPIPSRFVSSPQPDRAAEVKGRQILEKYNCGGCHQVRPGVFQFKPDDMTFGKLEEAYNNIQNTFASDHVFPEHNAWVGQPSPVAGRVMLHGIRRSGEDIEEGKVVIRLTQAIRFPGPEGHPRDLPAGGVPVLEEAEMISGSETFGGTFADLMVGYLMKLDSIIYKKSGEDSSDARAALPPPLLREGEKAQPEWLYQFLREPSKLRPQAILRMPKFNMSDDEARSLVNYFAAADRLGNPGIGLHYPYLTVQQRDERFWGDKNKEYVARLGPQKLEERAKQLQGVWEQQLKDQLADAEAKKTAAEAALKAAEGEAKKRAQEDLNKATARVQQLDAQVMAKDVKELRKEWEERDVYATDGYRLLLNHAQNICLSCHQVGAVPAKAQQGPPLELAFARLRPDWTLRWIAYPSRMISYASPMPQNFKRDEKADTTFFEGSSFEQATAVRDILMDLPRVADLPANRHYRTTQGGGK